MECTNKTIKELLPLYGKKEMDPADFVRVEDHLRCCEDCREELALLGMMISEVPDPGEDFWAALPERVYLEVKKRQKAPDRGVLGRGFGLLRYMLALRPVWISASVAATVLIVSLFVAGPRRQEPVPISAAADDYAYEDALGSDSGAPLPDLAELTPTEFDAASAWAGEELSAMALEAESVQGALSESDLSEELSELNSHELARLSAMLEALKKKEEQS